MPRRPFVFALLLAASPSWAQNLYDADRPFLSGSELQEWCRVESEADVIASGKTPYNWTSRHVERGNTLVVEGAWRVDGKRVQVECRVAKGAQRQHATLETRRS